MTRARKARVKQLINTTMSINTIQDLIKVLSTFKPTDLVVYEGTDGTDVTDLFSIRIDEIEGLQLTDGSLVSEIRICPVLPKAEEKPKTPMNDYKAHAIAEGNWEEEVTEEEIIEAWQHLHDTRLAYALQGWFGRTATQMIENGIIKP